MDDAYCMMANEYQVAVLAIFETSKIKESGVLLWRVRDLLDFFDSNPRFGSSGTDSFARTWAKTADEYVHVPICQGSIDLDELYYYDAGLRIVHLMLFSWG